MEGKKQQVNKRKPSGPATSFGGNGILTASADINEQISLEDGASLEHLSRGNRINGLCFLFFLTDLGARTFTRYAVHAGEDKKINQKHGKLSQAS